MADSKIFSGSLALLISGAGQSLIQILVLAVLARLIAPESFGILALTLAIGDLIRVLARFGISQAVVQRDGVGSTSLGTAYWSALVLGAMCSLGIFSIAGIVARYFSVPELEFVLSIFSISIFVRKTGSGQNNPVASNFFSTDSDMILYFIKGVVSY